MVKRRAERAKEHRFVRERLEEKRAEFTKPKPNRQNFSSKTNESYDDFIARQNIENARKWMEYTRQAQEEFQLVKKQTVIDLDKN